MPVSPAPGMVSLGHIPGVFDHRVYIHLMSSGVASASRMAGLLTSAAAEREGPTPTLSLSSFANLVRVGSEVMSHCLLCNSLIAL